MKISLCNTDSKAAVVSSIQCAIIRNYSRILRPVFLSDNKSRKKGESRQLLILSALMSANS